MTNPHLAMPKDPNSEIYFDPNRLTVGFRPRKEAQKKDSDLRPKSLRIVLMAFDAVIQDLFFPPGTTVYVGPGKQNTLLLPTRGLPDRHPLFDFSADGSLSLMINSHFDGVVQIEGKLASVEEAIKGLKGEIKPLKLGKASRGCLEHGNVLLYFEEIPEPERVPPVLFFKNLDLYFSRWLLISAALHAMLLLITLIVPSQPTDYTLEQMPESFQKIIIQPPSVKPYTPKIAMAGLTRGAQGKEGEGARAPGEEGRRGKGVPGKRMSGSEIEKTGILDVFARRGNKGVLAELLGGGGLPGTLNSDFGKVSPRYGLPGETQLREGKGLKGTGTGGGGLSTSIGQGLGTKGRGGGAKGTGLADFGTGRSDVAVSASIDEEEVYIMGNIPKEEIDRRIKNYLGQIRYCYEKELTVNPGLKGKVVTDFIIGLEGSVTSTKIKKTTMMNDNVERCIQNVIRIIPFPKPGGGVVEVIYPFLFRVAG